MLMARRLVEAGVRFVSLSYGGWDHHDNIKNAMTNQMPKFDQAFAALIRDLDQRGMLDSTLVMVTTEFGRTPKINGTAGQRMLLARRLVEAGVRFVSLTYGGWDHHDNIKTAMTGQMPKFDQAYAALIRDLDQRGMLDSTLVMVTTEFGRTPKINGTAGRDHYPKVFSIALAGGGIKRGLVHGSSDSTGGEPEDRKSVV